MSTAKAKIKELKKRHEELNKEIREQTQALFREACEEIFAEYPPIQKFAWTQYSPYFNDGDECVFSVNADAYINGEDNYGGTLHDDDDDDDETTPGEKVPESAYSQISDFLNSIDEDVMQAMFGNHVVVTVHRGKKKPEVEEHSHE